MQNILCGPLALLAFIMIGASLASCDGSPKNDQSSGLPGIPDELRDELATTCDYVDIIFYNSPASMSQDEPQSIRRALGFIGTPSPEISSDCRPMGRISYISSGQITAEGDIYLTDQCVYIIFMEDNKAVYANTLNNTGVQFFQSILQSINEQLPPQ